MEFYHAIRPEFSGSASGLESQPGGYVEKERI